MTPPLRGSAPRLTSLPAPPRAAKIRAMEGPALPSPADIDAIVAFLPILERPEVRLRSFYATPEIRRLQQALYDHRFIIPCDGPAWHTEAERYRGDPDALARAPLIDLCKLLTTHLRADRFIGGHFAAMVQSGHIAAILRRLAALRDPPSGPDSPASP